jgi:hypothetical protein
MVVNSPLQKPGPAGVTRRASSSRPRLPCRLGHPAGPELDAGRAIGIGAVPTTLRPTVMDRSHALFRILRTSRFHFASLGYPQGNFGPNVRKPTSETTFLNRWRAAVPWE